MEKKIVIIGAGPTGLGAAYRLEELNYKNWAIYEANDYIGGLAASFKDEKGFTWDIGGHITFSKSEYFNGLVKNLLKNKYLEHDRKSFIWIENNFIPYPIQNNIKDLPKEKVIECLMGLYDIRNNNVQTNNFKDWIFSVFGKGFADCFMLPYNNKVWAFPLEQMSSDWIANRVNKIEIKKLLENVIYNRTDSDWGPNNKFIYSLENGTAGLFLEMASLVKDKLYLGKKLVNIDLKNKRLEFGDHTKASYDILISTIPVDNLIKLAGVKKLNNESSELKHNSILVVGIGIKKQPPSDKCWMYFPEYNCPFYRVTYLSNYSPKNTPGKGYCSLMCETSYSSHKKVNKNLIIDETINGLINTKLIEKDDKELIVSKFLIDREYSYPIPSIGRDKALGAIQLFLEKNEIYSRGRFGSWKYENGNMDHSVMQGVGIVDRLLLGKAEQII